MMRQNLILDAEAQVDYLLDNVGVIKLCTSLNSLPNDNIMSLITEGIPLEESNLLFKTIINTDSIKAIVEDTERNKLVAAHSLVNKVMQYYANLYIQGTIPNTYPKDMEKICDILDIINRRLRTSEEQLIKQLKRPN